MKAKRKKERPVDPAALTWTLEQAAPLLNLAVITLRRLIARGKLRRVEGIRKVLIAKSELERFITQ